MLIDRPSSDWCLCHSDIHQANILLSKEGAVYIVDWDQPIIAPKERDLMFIGGGCAGKVSEGEEEFFYRGYGHTDVDWVMVAYYRYERIVQDFAVFAQEALLMPDTSEADKNRALMQVNAQFESGVGGGHRPPDRSPLARRIQSHWLLKCVIVCLCP